MDNCSNDLTLTIVEEYKDSRIRVLKNSSNIGSVKNFNRCINIARGEFIVLLPHDDLLLPTALEIFSKALISDPGIGLAYSSYYIIDEKGKRIRFLLTYDKDKVMTSDEAFTRLAEGNPIQCAMTRREIYSQIGTWDPNLKLVPDWDMWCRIVLAGYKTAYVKTPQNCYRVHSANGYRSFIQNNEYNSEIFKGLEKIYNFISAQSSLQKLRPLSAKWIFEPQATQMIKAMKIRNWGTFKEDLSLFIRILRWAGIREMWLDLKFLLSRNIHKHLYRLSKGRIHRLRSSLKFITNKSEGLVSESQK